MFFVFLVPSPQYKYETLCNDKNPDTRSAINSTVINIGSRKWPQSAVVVVVESNPS